MPAVGNESNHTFNGATIQGGLALVGAAGSTAYIDRDVAGFVARHAIGLRQQGYYAETVPRGVAGTSVAGTTQTLYCMAVGLCAGDVVSNMTVSQHAAGNTLTLVKLGLYSKAGVLLASSADVKANFLSTGVVTSPMSVAYTVVTDDVYYAAWLPVSGTTIPAIMQAAGAINGFGAVGAGSPNAVTQTGQTDLPATATLAAAAGGRVFWIGIS